MREIQTHGRENNTNTKKNASIIVEQQYILFKNHCQIAPLMKLRWLILLRHHGGHTDQRMRTGTITVGGGGVGVHIFKDI